MSVLSLSSLNRGEPSLSRGSDPYQEVSVYGEDDPNDLHAKSAESDLENVSRPMSMPVSTEDTELMAYQPHSGFFDDEEPSEADVTIVFKQ